MANSTYLINKGINKSIEFKGLKAQYIWYLGGGLVVLLVLFAIMYIVGLNPYLCLGIVLIAGGTLFSLVYKMSRKYGEFGLMKKAARRMIPKLIKNNLRQPFLKP